MIEISDKQWERLFTKVERPATEDAATLCWEWSGSRSMGVPQMFIGNGKGGGSSASVRRVVWEQTRGEEIPRGHIVTTSCENGLCVNPNHLVCMSRREFALRNGSPTAQNAAKTHCKNGHAMTELNTYIRKDGKGRQCRACARDQVKRHRRKQKAVEAGDPAS